MQIQMQMQGRLSLRRRTHIPSTSCLRPSRERLIRSFIFKLGASACHHRLGRRQSSHEELKDNIKPRAHLVVHYFGRAEYRNEMLEWSAVSFAVRGIQEA